MAHSQNSKESTLEYHKVEFCLQHYSTFTPLTFHSLEKTYKSQHTYADDITITISHTKHRKIKEIIQPYLCKIYKWAIINNLHINTDKTTATLFTPDRAKYSITLSLKLNNQTLPTTKHPKILGTTLDPKLTFSQHISLTMSKVKQTLNILKTLTSSKSGKQKQLIVSTFKAITRPILNYANIIWSSIISNTNIKKLQPFKTQLCESLLAVHKIQTLNIHDETKVLPMDSHLKLCAI